MGSESQWDLMKIARKLVKVIGKGLTSGMGVRKPGKMCVEAAVCYAMGLPHDDKPPCVNRAVRFDKVGLNDMGWSSDEARAEGLRDVAIAQLGSNTINGEKYRKECIKAMRRRFKNIADKETQIRFRKYLQYKNVQAALEELAETDENLTTAAQCIVDALRACKSPGVAILDQLKAEGVVPPSQFDEKVA